MQPQAAGGRRSRGAARDFLATAGTAGWAGAGGAALGNRGGRGGGRDSERGGCARRARVPGAASAGARRQPRPRRGLGARTSAASPPDGREGGAAGEEEGPARECGLAPLGEGRAGGARRGRRGDRLRGARGDGRRGIGWAGGLSGRLGPPSSPRPLAGQEERFREGEVPSENCCTTTLHCLASSPSPARPQLLCTLLPSGSGLSPPRQGLLWVSGPASPAACLRLEKPRATGPALRPTSETLGGEPSVFARPG